MHAQDSAGRTPLHYAATLPDNGHFYSLLVTLGADKAFPDNVSYIMFLLYLESRNPHKGLESHF